MVINQLRGPVTKLMKPIYETLARLGIHPDMLTILGFGLSLVAGWAFASHEYLIAAIFITFGGLMDLLDGGVARVGGYASNEGAFLDSVMDRIGESAIYIGIVISFTNIVSQLVALGILVFSFSISYLRARGEGLGVSLAGIGIMERAERMAALVFAALLAYIYTGQVFIYALYIIFGLILLTAIHRFFKVYVALKIPASTT